MSIKVKVQDKTCEYLFVFISQKPPIIISNNCRHSKIGDSKTAKLLKWIKIYCELFVFLGVCTAVFYVNALSTSLWVTTELMAAGFRHSFCLFSNGRFVHSLDTRYIFFTDVVLLSTFCFFMCCCFVAPVWTCCCCILSYLYYQRLDVRNRICLL